MICYAMLVGIIIFFNSIHDVKVLLGHTLRWGRDNYTDSDLHSNPWYVTLFWRVSDDTKHKNYKTRIREEKFKREVKQKFIIINVAKRKEKITLKRQQ